MLKGISKDPSRPNKKRKPSVGGRKLVQVTKNPAPLKQGKRK